MKTTIKAIIPAIVILILSFSTTCLCLQDKITNYNTAIRTIDNYVNTYNTDNVAMSKIIAMSADAELFSEFGVNNINATVNHQELKCMITENFCSDFYKYYVIVLIVLLIPCVTVGSIIFLRC